eukprot:jgi/Botrbrau1/8362/Bobra.0046s0023.1
MICRAFVSFIIAAAVGRHWLLAGCLEHLGLGSFKHWAGLFIIKSEAETT